MTLVYEADVRLYISTNDRMTKSIFSQVTLNGEVAIQSEFQLP
jgi:hypothetical protein